MSGDKYLGQVGVVLHGTSFVARGIQWITGSPAFHAVVGVGDGDCIGAEPGGARVRPVEYWAGAVWSRYDLTEDQARGVADWALEREGAPYAYLDDALLGLTYAWGVRWPKWVRRHLSSDRQWMCSELADAALTLGGGLTVFDDGRDFCEVAPAHLYDLFMEEGWA